MVEQICMCLHSLTRTCSSFSGHFQRDVVIVTFRLSWIDFALLAFLLTHTQTPRPDTGERVPVPWGGQSWKDTGACSTRELAGQRGGQQGSSRSLALAPPLQTLCSD